MNNKINKTIKQVYIKGFKNILDDEFIFKNLTFLTGENGGGKTSLIQALLLAGNQQHLNILNYLNSLGIRELFNKEGIKDIYVSVISGNDTELSYKIDRYNLSLVFQTQNALSVNFLSYPQNLIYLNANRQPIPTYTNFNPAYNIREFGIYGEWIINYYEHNKRNEIANYLIKDLSSYTLESQVNYWLKYITNYNINFYSEKINFSQIQNYFVIDNVNYLPQNIGTGFSYLLSILILCLSAKKGNIIIIENPEIHLHPKSQAKLGEFFAFIASKGIQLVIETHNDHILNKVA